MNAVSIDVPAELVDAIAERAAELVLERLRVKAVASESRYLTVDEAASLYRCKPQRIYDLISSGRLPKKNDGSRVLLERAELERRLEEGGRLAAGVPVL